MSGRPPELAEVPAATSPVSVLEENRRLKRTMRDLVALSTLPAVWGPLSRDGVARSLCDVLLNTLVLDLVYARLDGVGGTPSVEVVRSKGGDAAREEAASQSIRQRLEPNRDFSTLPDPSGSGSLRVAVVHFGLGGEHGVLVACSTRTTFPTDQDRLLLSVAANHTAIVAQRRSVEEQAEAHREWLRVTLESIGDAVIATDMGGRVTFLNSVASEMTGWTSADAEGLALSTVFRIMDEQTRRAFDDPLEEVRQQGRLIRPADHTLLISRLGVECPIDETAAPIRDNAGQIIGMVLVFRPVTERRRRERYRAARSLVTQQLSRAATVREAATAVVAAVCENLGWDLGCYWVVNEEKDWLECFATWNRADNSMATFLAQSVRPTFAKGEGLPGRVWLGRKAAWIEDVTKEPNFPRAAVAIQHGLISAFACPVVIGERTLGVIEYFARGNPRPPDADLLEMMGSVAAGLAQFIERKTAEEELRRSEAELAEFFENATIGLHWVGPDGTILRANRAELEMLGYSREEYVGRSIREFHAAAEVIQDILTRLGAGENLVEYPAQLRCKDGSLKHVLIDSSVMWKDGEFVHTRCFTRDITQRRRAEMAFADARARLNAALEAGAIATWTWDIPNNRLFADSHLAQLFNLPPSEGAGGLLDKYVQSIHPEDVARTLASLNHAVESGTPYVADYRIVQADGSIRWVTARGVVERDPSGRPVRMPGVLVDITARKVLEEELRVHAEQLTQADRRKDEFLATLAHELRNPLAPIRNSLEILKMPRIDAATIQQIRAMMERQVHHLVRLVDDLLDVSRVMRGKISLQRESVELATVIARAIETARPLIDVQGHTIELSLPPESLQVDADPVRLAQVIGNLLTNSAKYTEANGHIWVRARREGAQVALRVRDDGIGIAPEVLPHVFELFVQADPSSTKAHGGLGIGLTLAKNLVQMHGGSIEANSPGLGAGCEFTVRLPLLSSPGTAGDAPHEEREAVPSPSGRRILLVDDNEDAATSLAILLRLQGHEVRVAHDGPSALATAASCLPDLILLDIGMPGMDGYEVARRLRAVPGLQTVTLAALTGWGQQEDRRRTAEAGFDHHFVKPVDAKALGGLLNESRAFFPVD